MYGLPVMKNHCEQDVSTYIPNLSTFFEGLNNSTNSARESHTTDLQGFFNGLGPIIRIAEQAQIKLDRLIATPFSLFDFFNEREEDLSRILGGMLNPSGTHGQGDAFLRLFLEAVFKVLDKEVKEGFPTRDLCNHYLSGLKTE